MGDPNPKRLCRLCLSLRIRENRSSIPVNSAEFPVKCSLECRVVVSEVMPYVEIEGQARALGPGVLTIGSAPEAGWRFQGRGLEPLHAVIAMETGARAMLMPGAVEAGIRVNDVLLDGRTFLSFGDTVRLGMIEMHYRQFAPGEAGQASAYLRDTRRGRVYLLRERSTVGRDATSTVVIQEPDVSRTHLEIVRHDEAYLVIPHPSSVVSVNGARLLAPAPLQEGDEIAIGRTTLRFTGAMPSGMPLVDQPSPARAGREARAKTSFVGRIEADELRDRDKRRKMNRLIVVVVAIVALGAAIASMILSAHPHRGTNASSNATSRSHL